MVVTHPHLGDRRAFLAHSSAFAWFKARGDSEGFQVEDDDDLSLFECVSSILDVFDWKSVIFYFGTVHTDGFCSGYVFLSNSTGMSVRNKL